MLSGLERRSLISFIDKVNGGRYSRQCFSATLAPCLLFGLIFLLHKKLALNIYSGVPFGASILVGLFYLVGLKSKEESLVKRLFNQFLFCLVTGLGSLYLCILFLLSTEDLKKSVVLFIVVLIYLVIVCVIFSISFLKLIRGKYEKEQSKVMTPYIYVIAAIFGLSLSRVFRNNNYAVVILPYIMAIVLFVISLANIPFFTNILRIYLVKKFNISLDEVRYYNLPYKESLILSNKRRLINTFFVGSVFYGSVIFETIKLNSVYQFSKKRGFILCLILLLFAINVSLSLFNAFYKMDNTKNSIFSALLGYFIAIIYFAVTMFLLKQTKGTKVLEPVMLELIFIYSMIIHVIISLLLSLFVAHFKKSRQQ